ncbi:hypothetical protein Y032_0312g2171 [Ancylostoma ceylanicum]|uniref:Uncharacterized protein n=1 Tax=Ancylostoma ceylanicum TaxID=53326 RepID=A0A016S2E7_9BILA|nr:hypothetical protein Y032_0312g2171 [Ancylostoma ceylanicum]
MRRGVCTSTSSAVHLELTRMSSMSRSQSKFSLSEGYNQCLCDCKDIKHCELLPRYIALTADLYCQRLHRMAVKFAGKGPNYGTIQFLHDSACPVTTRVTRQKLFDFGWEVLTSPPYRNDLVARDCQLFLTLSNALQGKACDDEDDLDR